MGGGRRSLPRDLATVARRRSRRARKRKIVAQRGVPAAAGEAAAQEQYPAGQGGESGRPLGVFGDVVKEGAEVGENGADEVGARFDDGPGHG
jgi:hypothetical protein